MFVVLVFVCDEGVQGASVTEDCTVLMLLIQQLTVFLLCHGNEVVNANVIFCLNIINVL